MIHSASFYAVALTMRLGCIGVILLAEASLFLDADVPPDTLLKIAIALGLVLVLGLLAFSRKASLRSVPGVGGAPVLS
ncbi:MAG: hypothetical protein AAFX62_17930 [Pseudomonadota bacterium]